MNTESYADLHRKWIIPTTIGSEEKDALVRGNGVWVWDENGKKYFDACSQVSCANIGHNHPKFTALMKHFWHEAGLKNAISVTMGTDFFYENYLYKRQAYDFDLTPIALADRLAPHLFGKDNTIFGFQSTGAEGVNLAIRYFRTITEKKYWISFEKAFHGRHGESRDSSDSNPVHWNEAERNGNVFFLPFPETFEDLKRAKERLNGIPLKECACLIYEPVQGEGGGMRVGWYLRQLETILKEEGIFSISDEIQSGLGRCGAWFGYQQLGLNPDAVVMGKTLGSGVPVSAIGIKRDAVGKKPFMPGKVSGTFSMSPIGMAAANITMHIYEEEKIVENAAKLSPLFHKILYEAIESFNENDGFNPYFKVDGIGLYKSIKPYTFTGNHDAGKRNQLVEKLRELGVWTLGASKNYPAVRLTPPLISTESDLKFLADALAKAIRSA
ncbi:MAG: hypothetical protein A3G49_03385 [Candidatus Sungbacteria bacterium RIFCSPLOWO2_12_FULL_41_11]|uniref:4-aminobutyrate aminotransferase n=1 Tax=Candidatus Sungbacteria bacterium RIFCSPLOWO2_12_FULL_41_11 TaxID=1802286 RepID=A0A1G2LSX5_9BACT|nr:MAG: 4-aminobutyrate aminotransferase [Parcubacteria group bacterium GW2011_GWA2_42_14]OHA14748.1 MAG: hypothetical protein A3G49_03385 [Candidatus Sungbacteria bacterium RIFCSPLOWO2_12_FULL_41_11]